MAEATFALRTKHAAYPLARLTVGEYTDGSTAWEVWADCGAGWEEPVCTPTVALEKPPPAGHVYLRVAEQYAGCMESLEQAGIVRDTGERRHSGYAAVCLVLRPELLAEQEDQSRRQWLDAADKEQGL